LSASAKTDARPVAGGAFLNPWVLAAVVILLLNDHWWKRAFPGFVTGKISDVAGLAFFPLLLQAAWETAQAALRRPWHPSRRVLVACIVATGVVFSLVKLWPPAGEAYRHSLGALQWPFAAVASWVVAGELPPRRPVALVQDPTDLLALPALAIAAWIGWRRSR
jgi:hypothetical protein